MASSPKRCAVLTALAITLAACGAFAVPAHAQDSPSWNKDVPKPEPKPTRRAPAPRRAPPPARRVEPPAPSAPLLSVQYRVLKINPDNTQVEVSPVTVFNRGDRVRIAVKANQDVYLYVVNQKAAGQSGRVVIPDSQLNNGQNFLAKDQEVAFPSGCASGAQSAGCSYAVDNGAAPEFFTMIFSRSPAVSLLETAVEAGGDIKGQALDAYAQGAGQNLDTTARGDTVFSRRIRALRPADQVVVRFALNKRG
jgi:hypothetical protein